MMPLSKMPEMKHQSSSNFIQRNYKSIYQSVVSIRLLEENMKILRALMQEKGEREEAVGKALLVKVVVRKGKTLQGRKRRHTRPENATTIVTVTSATEAWSVQEEHVMYVDAKRMLMALTVTANHITAAKMRMEKLDVASADAIENMAMIVITVTTVLLVPEEHGMFADESETPMVRTGIVIHIIVETQTT